MLLAVIKSIIHMIIQEKSFLTGSGKPGAGLNY